MRQIIAILRGIIPSEAGPVTQALVAAGISRIEVPLNSPDPFESLRIMVDVAGADALIGAGTVLAPEEVLRLAQLGAEMVVSPDTNPRVIVAAKQAGLLCYPGVFTATEALSALRNGADGLKLFPASVLGPAGLAALRAVLPEGTPIYAVGGVGPESFQMWRGAGALGFGLGGALYSPGRSAADVAQVAQEIVAAYDALEG